MKAALIQGYKRFKSLHRGIRITTYLTLSYGLYALIVGVALPAAIQAQAPKMLAEMLGREVKLEQVKINPFLLRVEINHFSVSEKESGSDFFRLSQLKTEYNFWQSLFDLTPTLEYLEISGPYLQVARLSVSEEETRFNFSDIPEHIAAVQSETADNQAAEDLEADDEPVEAGDEAAELFPFRAGSVRLTGGELKISDNRTGVEFGYPDINLTLDSLDSQAQSLSPDMQPGGQAPENQNRDANRYNLSLKASDNSLLSTQGQFQLLPLEVKGGLELKQLQLARFWPLTEKIIKAELSRGALDFSSLYHLTQQEDEFAFSSENGRFALSDLAFEYNKQPKVTLSELILDGISVSTADRAVLLEKFSLDKLWLDAVLTEKGADLPGYFTPDSAKAEGSATEKQSSQDSVSDEAPWLVTLNGIDVTSTEINLKESMVSDGIHWRVYPLNLSTGEVKSDLSHPVEYKLNLELGSDYKKKPVKSSGKFSSSGSVNVSELEVSSQFSLSGLELRQFQRYMDPHANLTLSDGLLSIGGKLDGDSKGKVLFNGQASLDKLLLKDVLEKEPLVKWNRMTLNEIDFSQSAQSLKIKSVLLDQPYAKVLIAKDQRTNIGEISKKETAADTPAGSELSATTQQSSTTQQSATSAPDAGVKTAEKKAGGAENDFRLDIEEVVIANGSAFFADYSMTPNFASGIELIEGYIRNISSDPAARAEVKIDGKIDKYAPVSLSGEVNPLSQPPYMDLDFSLDSAELTSVNPYSGTYAGYYIDKGQLSLDINYRLENNQLEGNNHVVVDQLTLGKPSESDLATTLPVTLAVGLLKDSDGVIDLGFDVAGDVSSPEFSFGGAILKVIGNIITKAVTAPFSLLANLVDSDEDLDFVEFDAGIAALNSGAEQKLSKLSEALKTRPELAISVEGSVVPQEDSRIMAEERLKAKLLKTSGLNELPLDLSASRVPESGPLPQALETLFVQEVSPDLAAERSRIEQSIIEQQTTGQEGEATQDSAQLTQELDPTQVRTALNISLYNQLVSAQDISDSDLGLLAESRAKSVKAFLVENEIDPSRIFILDSKSKLKTEQRQALMTIDVK